MNQIDKEYRKEYTKKYKKSATMTELSDSDDADSNKS